MNKIFNKNEEETGYIPDEKESSFILQVYQDYADARKLKNESQPILGGKTLKQYWDRCNWDYNVLIESKAGEAIVSYASTISRDKSNVFITNLTLQLMYPSVTAQNQNQEIDNVMGKVSRSILEWCHDNDGAPAENGHQKQVRYTHKGVIEGTSHIQDDWIDGKLVSQLIPNEEIFIKNFWQPNIQLQPFIMRVQDNITFEEAQREFGDLPNWQYVKKGDTANWGIDIDSPLFKESFEGICEEDKVQIVRFWYDIPKKEFKKYNVPRGRKKAKLLNVLINGVLMFKIDNLSPYHHGLFPINKGIFEHFSKAEYYWGNSMPNKAGEDKKWLDGWKTLIRHKAKLAAIPPLLTFNGSFVDSDIFIPGQATQAPSGMKPEDIIAVPGINLKGVESGDIAIMQEAKNEIEAGNLSPQASGAQGKQQTAREAIIREQNEQQILGGFGLQVAFLIQARTFPILKMAYQFLPRKKIKKLAIPNQMLNNGMSGNLEIIFEKQPAMNKNQMLEASYEILDKEEKAQKAGHPIKIVKINPEYIKNLDLYVKSVVDPQPKKTSALRKAEAQEKYATYRADPEMFNIKAAARRLVRDMGDDEMEMINNQPPQQQGQQMPTTGGRDALKRVSGQETAKLGELK